MGTRASFWIGNPMHLDKREWLGCIAWDGYPEGIEGIDQVKTEADFKKLVNGLSSRDDFDSPIYGWPYPWRNDIFLTDFTYAFFDGGLKLTCFRRGFQTLETYLNEQKSDMEFPDTLPDYVPATKPYDPRQPDSIIIISSL